MKFNQHLAFHRYWLFHFLYLERKVFAFEESCCHLTDHIIPSMCVGSQAKPDLIKLLLHFVLKTVFRWRTDRVIYAANVDCCDRCDNGSCSCTKCFADGSVKKTCFDLVD